MDERSFHHLAERGVCGVIWLAGNFGLIGPLHDAAEIWTSRTMSDESDRASPADWTPLLDELRAQAVAALGKRSKKIINVLAAADQSETGIEAAIDQIASMRVTFVDPVRLADLADAMRVVLATHTGRPLPARQSGVPFLYGDSDPGFMAAAAGVTGCLGPLICIGAVLTTILIARVVPAHLLALL